MLSTGKPRKVGSDALPCHVSSQGDLVARRLPLKGRQLNYILEEKATVFRKAGFHATCILIFLLFVAMPASLLAAIKLKSHFGNLVSLEGVISNMAGNAAQHPAEEPHARPAASLPEYVDLTVTVALDQATHNIPERLYGIFFEEINHAGESGLYGEMVRNRGVEAGGPRMPASVDPWTPVGDISHVEVSSDLASPHERNPVALRVDVTCGAPAAAPAMSGTPHGDLAGRASPVEEGDVINSGDEGDDGAARSPAAAWGECGEDVGVSNPGYWGMNVVARTRYTASFWLRVRGLTSLRVSLVGGNADELAAGTLWLPGGACPSPAELQALSAECNVSSGGEPSRHAMLACTHSTSDTRWMKVIISLLATAPDTDASLHVTSRASGTFWMDIISLFPEPLGLTDPFRRDILGAMQGLAPKFLRFPGGCFVEGDSLRNGFRWHETLGRIEERPGHLNDVWGYWSEDGLGLLEYLTLAERLGATPIWVFNMGKSHREAVPPNAIGPWVRDVLNGIEFARGSATSHWGRVRANMGRPEPFDLKFVAIGNENCGNYYFENYMAFYRPIHKRWKDITVISNCELDAAMVPPGGDLFDFHVYATPDEIFKLHTRFDNHPRGSSRVFVSEYASVGDLARGGTLRGAIAEAAFLTGIERNSDLVVMASYAPLLVNVNDRRWDPNAINFNNHALFGTPSYWLQSIFHAHVGTVGLRAESAQSGADGPDGRPQVIRLPDVAEGGMRRDDDGGGVRDASGASRVLPLQTMQVAYSATAATPGGTSAGRSADGLVYVKVVNYESRPLAMYVVLEGVPASAVAPLARWTFVTGDGDDRNSFEEPHKVYPASTMIQWDGKGFFLQLPALTAGVLTVNTTAAPWLPLSEEL